MCTSVLLVLKWCVFQALLSTIVAVLSAEEQVLGLRQPTGVGTRPRPMATELCNQNDTVTETATTTSSPTGPLPSPAVVDEDDGGAHSEGAPAERSTIPVAALQLHQTFKHPTRLSSNAFAPNQQVSNWVSTFGGSDEGNDTNKRKLPHDASCTVMQQARSKVRGDGLIDSFAQVSQRD